MGLQSIASAVLRMALTDAVRGWNPVMLEEFAESEWCGQLCDVVGISWMAYRRDMADRMNKYIDRSKPKRIRTYELARVLRKDGKDTGKCKDKGNPEISGA